MNKYQIVIDTNVLISALRSCRGASHKLLTLIDRELFEINISIPLILEYEDVAKRLIEEINLSENDIDDILDYLCTVSNRRKIFYLYRPYLRDADDDMVLELAVAAKCDFIITHNIKHFQGISHLGIRALTPKEFLELSGVK
ncbi:MAG: putative toxin-antitoxin system toxin component, PIN family [Candidatus Omnitrophota bacterium]|jgi:putative PIN family toxin of toxin-antitoxin system|nr:MAG: putative toxin-antitoxin system toxin component, PIN family [Candidatus Omnitrophota bacterium]